MTSPLESAVRVLRAHGIVGMPTETVYGLAADARSDDAVAKVFALKGRPSTNPLIVHVASVEVAERYAVLDDRARRLFAKFAPGPLTIVLPLLSPSPGTQGEGRGEGLRVSLAQDPHPNPLPGYRERGPEAPVSRLVTAGLDTVGIRIPDHPLALELLLAFDGPLAAPSANKSNHVSPTTAEHVRSEFGDAFPILDGGACRVGIESTVLSLATDTPMILRPGSVSREAIETVIGPVDAFFGHVATTVAATAPGQQEKHYAPTAPALRCDRETIEALSRNDQTPTPTPTAVRSDASRERALANDPTAQRSAWIVFLDLNFESRDHVISLGGNPLEAAHRFYAALRTLDQARPAQIFIEMPPDEPRWAALRDRITRATRPYVPDR